MIASYSASYALELPSLSKRSLLKGVVTGALRRKDDRFGGRLHILGSRGSVFIAGGKVELLRGTRRQVFRSKTLFPMVEELRDFHSAIKGQASLNKPLEGFRDASLIHAILESASSGESVSPELA
jgi:predicted dehydrogenase